jgi:hypothetical protein
VAFDLAAWLRLRRCSGISVTGQHDRRPSPGLGNLPVT